MNSTSTVGMRTHRKLIDIPENVFQALNIKAAAMGTNLKNYIEELLIREIEDMDDAENKSTNILYRHVRKGKRCSTNRSRQTLRNGLRITANESSFFKRIREGCTQVIGENTPVTDQCIRRSKGRKLRRGTY